MTMNVAENATSSPRCGISSSSNSPSSTKLLGRCNSAEPRVFHELRHEIHLVKFPEDEDRLRRQQRKLEKKMKKKTRQKSITITTPDGKKVKQRKSENESMTPCPLKLALKNTDKGDVYVRADGKIVRLVKKKEKKRKEKEQKRAFKAEMKRLRKEAELKAEEEEEQQRQAQLQQQREEEAAALSWQEVEEQKERIFKEHWQGNKATQTDETKRLSYQEAKAVFVTKKKTPAAAPLAVSEDEESTTSEYEEEADAEDVASVSSAPESAFRDASTLTFGTYTTADTTQMTQSEAGDQDDEDEEDGDEGDDQFPTTTDNEEVQVFYVSVDEEGNIDDDDLPFVKRMSQKSIEILAKANEMKFQSLFIEKVSDLRDERFHAVNVPKHPTQSNDYKPKNGGGRMPRRCRTDASAAREQQSQRSSSGGPAFRRNMTS